MGLIPGSQTLPFRRCRALFVVVAIAVVFVFFSGGIYFHEDSRAKVANYFGTSELKVDEIYGLIHLVTSKVERTLDKAVDLDPSEPVDLSIYAGGTRQIDWRGEVKRLDANYPIVVFSKTYCPYSRRAKKILSSYDIRPTPYIVEVNTRDDGNIIKTLLGRMTGRATFPNIIVRGRSIGGSDDLQALHESQRLKKMLQEAGATVRAQDV